MRWLLLLALLLTGCGHERVVSIEPVYQIYVDTFIAEAAKRGRTIIIDDLIIQTVPKLDGYTFGMCEVATWFTPTISVSKKLWDIHYEPQREILILHELGHCILGYDHYDEKAAIMNSDLGLVVGYLLTRTDFLDRYYKNGQ